MGAQIPLERIIATQGFSVILSEVYRHGKMDCDIDLEVQLTRRNELCFAYASNPAVPELMQYFSAQGDLKKLSQGDIARVLINLAVTPCGIYKLNDSIPFALSDSMLDHKSEHIKTEGSALVDMNKKRIRSIFFTPSGEYSTEIYEELNDQLESCEDDQTQLGILNAYGIAREVSFTNRNGIWLPDNKYKRNSADIVFTLTNEIVL